MTAQPIRQTIEDRAEPRDEVYHRTRLTLPNRRTVSAVVVNLSPHGLMIRVDADIAAGDAIGVILPVVGAVIADVRWSLGGRIGCKLRGAIEARRYAMLLGAIGH